jgi:amino acid transporter
MDLLFLSLGGIIGSGWLFAASGAATLAGPSAVVAWIIGGLIVLAIALVYSELGGMIPRSGAIVRYAQFSHDSFAGYIFGWAYFLSAVSVPAIEAEAVVTYASTYINGLVAASGVLTIAGILIAMLLMFLFFILNYVGIKIMGKTNTGVTWWKLIIPLLTVLILLGVGFNAGNFSLPTGFLYGGWPMVFASISLSGIVFSYLGFRQALDYGGEAKTPQKSIPRATIGSVLIGIALYTFLQIVFIGHVDWHSIGVGAGNWGALSTAAGAKTLYDAPFATLATSAGLVLLTYVLYADAYISPSGTLSVYLGTSQRTLYGMAANGYYPAALTKIHEKFRVPILPLVASLVVGFIFFLPFPSWYKLVGFISGATVFTYIVGGSALMALRKHAPELKRPFRLAGASILSPIAFVGSALIVYWTGWPYVAYIAAAIFFGLVVYAVLFFTSKVDNIFTAKSVKSGLWVPLFILALLVLSYLGETTYGGIGVFPFPYDFVVVIIVSLIFYAISVVSAQKTDEIEQMIALGSQYVATEGPAVKGASEGAEKEE